MTGREQRVEECPFVLHCINSRNINLPSYDNYFLWYVRVLVSAAKPEHASVVLFIAYWCVAASCLCTDVSGLTQQRIWLICTAWQVPAKIVTFNHIALGRRPRTVQRDSPAHNCLHLVADNLASSLTSFRLWGDTVCILLIEMDPNVRFLKGMGI